MSSGPPRRMKIGEVPGYVKEKYGLNISRQTAYNWTKLGLRDEALQYTDMPASKSRLERVRITTTEWVDQFCERTGINRGGSCTTS